MYSTTTCEAAELLLSWIYDTAHVPDEAVTRPLVAQLWLGQNARLLHSRRSMGVQEAAEAGTSAELQDGRGAECDAADAAARPRREPTPDGQ